MNRKIIVMLTVAALVVACNSNKKSSSDTNVTQTETRSEGNHERKIVIKLESKSNSGATGTVTFTEKEGVVYMQLKGSGFTPGEHAIHLHEFANCSANDGISAGGHWNPTSEAHGKWGKPPYHKGDIGNFIADTDGNVNFTFQTDQWCLGCGDDTKNIIGKSVIIHEHPDDFVTQPTGNAGGRICCGEILE